MFVVILRGLPGSGKSHIAQEIRAMGGAEVIVCSADDYFMSGGEYRFNPKDLGRAHAACQKKFWTAALRGARRDQELILVVDNTCTQAWEMEPYLPAIMLGGCVFSLFDGGCSDEELAARNKHGVPAQKIAEMRARWEKYQGELTDVRAMWRMINEDVYGACRHTYTRQTVVHDVACAECEECGELFPA